jgi:hypothetical protein
MRLSRTELYRMKWNVSQRLYVQRQMIDFAEVFAPVARLKPMDVNLAFLNGELAE